MNIVITGVSRGLGYNLALEFLKDAKNKVFGLSRDEKGLDKIKAKTDALKNFYGTGCDITDVHSVERAVDFIGKNSDRKIDVLINNAGTIINKPFLDLTNEDWKKVYDVNVFGLINVTRKLLPLLQGGTIFPEQNINAHVINISSMGGVQGSMKFSGLSAYSSSKGAVITIGECLAEEFKLMGIRVNTIALGSVETEMFANAFPGLTAASKPEKIAVWIKDFSISGFKFFNGKLLEMSVSTP